MDDEPYTGEAFVPKTPEKFNCNVPLIVVVTLLFARLPPKINVLPASTVMLFVIVIANKVVVELLVTFKL